MLRTLCILAILGIGSVAGADDTLPAPVTFTAVDQFEHQGTDFTIVGILSGQSTDTTFTLGTADNTSSNATGNACERAALMMMSRPGRFQMLITPDDYDNNVRCRLIRLTQ